MKSNNVVEINGKLYDAKTGAPLHKHTAAQPVNRSAPKALAKPVKSAPKAVDGFSRHPNAKSKPHKAIVPAKKQAAPSQSRQAPKNMRLKAGRSTTLNRKVVKAPKISSANVPTNSPVSATENLSSSALKQSDARRLQRAQKVSKSSVISRFNHSSALAQVPESNPAKDSLTAHLTASHHESPAPETPKHLSTKEQLVKRAIKAASTPSGSAHHSGAKKHHSKKSHLAQYASTAVAALVLAGYVAYLNVPSISMKVAAHRAGFAASLPTYKPAGYSLNGPIAYSPGKVTLNFDSNTDDRSFSLSQQPTTWDSTALLENHVTKQSKNYLTYQDQGLTIYIYNGDSAAWVNAGKMYHVEGKNSQLDTNQLLKLATGI